MPDPDIRRPDVRREAGLAARFGLAGLVNTAVGYLAILAFDLGLGLPSPQANLLGYAAGLLVAAVLHKRFVFRSNRPLLNGRYLAAIAISYAINLAVLTLTGRLFESPLITQALAVASYAMAQFLLLRLWVFREQRLSPPRH